MPNKAERDAWKEKLVNEAEQKILELTDSDKFKKYLDTLSKFHGYSQRNIDLIYSQDPAATQVAGYKQWQNDFNRHVNKGAKSIRISAPIIKKLTEEEKRSLIPRKIKQSLVIALSRFLTLGKHQDSTC